MFTVSTILCTFVATKINKKNNEGVLIILLFVYVHVSKWNNGVCFDTLISFHAGWQFVLMREKCCQHTFQAYRWEDVVDRQQMSEISSWWAFLFYTTLQEYEVASTVKTDVRFIIKWSVDASWMKTRYLCPW